MKAITFWILIGLHVKYNCMYIVSICKVFVKIIITVDLWCTVTYQSVKVLYHIMHMNKLSCIFIIAALHYPTKRCYSTTRERCHICTYWGKSYSSWIVLFCHICTYWGKSYSSWIVLFHGYLLHKFTKYANIKC